MLMAVLLGDVFLIIAVNKTARVLDTQN